MQQAARLGAILVLLATSTALLQLRSSSAKLSVRLNYKMCLVSNYCRVLARKAPHERINAQLLHAANVNTQPTAYDAIQHPSKLSVKKLLEKTTGLFPVWVAMFSFLGFWQPQTCGGFCRS